MYKPFRTSILFIFIVAAIGVVGASAQTLNDEFVSIGGRFAITLPQKYLEYKTLFGKVVLGQRVDSNYYRWVMGEREDSERQVLIAYSDLPTNVEAAPDRDTLLEALRDDFLGGTPRPLLIGEKKTQLDSHPGLIFVFEGRDNLRAMVWTYLVKNRVYTMTLTLKDPNMVENDVKLLSTFRLVSSKDLEPRYAKLITELTPQSLAQERGNTKPTSDLQDLGLKGKVRRIVTESEMYHGDELFGNPIRAAEEEFNERGDLVKGVDFAGSVPQAVRSYGYINGERVYRERSRERDVVLIKEKGISSADPREKGDKSELFKLKYKYDSNDRLTEMRLLGEDGQEQEKYVYGSGKIEHTFDPLKGIDALAKLAGLSKIKEIQSTDAAGNVVEISRSVRDKPDSEAITLDGKVQMIQRDRYKTETYKYLYEFDDQGNWIKRITVSVEKKKEGIVEVRCFMSYRNIAYY